MPDDVPAAPLAPATLLIPVFEIEESRSNPRKFFDQASMQELADSIREVGVMQPVLVRPKAVPVGTIRFELVAGHRRFRATQLAGLATIPALVRELDDRQVLELQITENLQREGLHPIEEAESYEALCREHGYTREAVALKIGKSKGYVNARLELLRLTGPVREAFASGGLGIETARLLSALPAELQPKAHEHLQAATYNDEPLSFRQAKLLLLTHYATTLDAAPWPLDVVVVGVDAPACTACPKRTSQQLDLVPDAQAADRCLDTACYGAKRVALFAGELERYRKQGLRVIEGDDAVKAFRWVDTFSGFQALTETAEVIDPADEERDVTVAELLGAKYKATVLVLPERAGRDAGRCVLVAPDADVRAAEAKWRKKHKQEEPPQDAEANDDTDGGPTSDGSRVDAHRAWRELRDAVLKAVAASPFWAPTADDVVLLGTALAAGTDPADSDVLDLLRLDLEEQQDLAGAELVAWWTRHLEALPPAEAARRATLMALSAVTPSYHLAVQPGGHESTWLVRYARRLGMEVNPCLTPTEED